MKKKILQKVILTVITSSMLVTQTLCVNAAIQVGENVYLNSLQSSIDILKSEGDLETA